MKVRAALIWDMDEEDVSFDKGTFLCAKTEDTISFRYLSARLMGTGGPISCSVSDASPGSGPIIAGNLVDVEVDPETGKVTILNYTVVQDAGKAIHPSYVEGQMQGGAVQGIGWALNEEYIYDEEGVLDNPGFLDYRVPVASDVPMIDCEIVEVANPTHPYGVRGVGETPIVAPLAAVGNAVSQALGIRMTDLPLSPPRLLDALASRVET